MDIPRIRQVAPVAAVAVLLLAGWFFFVRQGTSPYQLASVTRGDMTEEVLASGNVESADARDLHFKINGKLASLNVNVGDTVLKGQLLASLDGSSLEAAYNAAQASLAKEEALLNKTLAGTRSEDIAVTAAAKESASVSLTNKEHDLGQVIAKARTDLDSILASKVDQLFEDPETSPSFGITIESGTEKFKITVSPPSERITINGLRRQVGDDIEALKDSALGGDELLIESQKARDALDDMAMLLQHIADALDNYTGDNTTAQAVYQSYQSAIASGRTTTETDRQSLISAIASYNSALSSLEEADKTLAQKTAPSRSEDVSAQQASVNAAHANVDAAAAALSDARITAPLPGLITDTNGKVGEVVNPNTTVVSLMPDEPLDIKVNVSEDNIIGVRVGDPVRIELDAFPQGTQFSGTVEKIDPAETVIGGAVYYETTVLFDKGDPDIRPGMTANVWIETGRATSTLMVPASAITTTSTGSTVHVLENGTSVTKQIMTGLRGENGMIEVTSGLSEGEQVIVGE